ncbi:MAG: hypothetical protein SOX46_11555 [Clostridiaceae bacterium]|nr:hypothetical protein [Clostridium sp.]MDY3232192.1 hypothetical protein [Clostridiaceae bacterium]
MRKRLSGSFGKKPLYGIGENKKDGRRLSVRAKSRKRFLQT